MKKFILATLLATFAGLVHAQIPNGNFETWESFMGTGIKNPSKFFTSNISIFQGGDTSVKRVAGKTGYGVSLTSHAYMEDGQQVVNPGTMLSMSSFDLFSGEFNSKFPLEKKPLRMKGYYAYEPQGNDKFSISILAFKDGEVIVVGEFADDAATVGYEEFSIDLEYDGTEEPDSAMITVSSSAEGVTEGTVLMIDEFTLEYQVGTSVKEAQRAEILAAFPVPSTGKVTVDTRSFERETFQVEVYDLNGRSVSKQYAHAAGEMLELQLADLGQGTYFLVLSDGVKTGRTRIIISQ